MIQFGGQTPLKLARAIEAAGYRIIGTPYDAIDLAEDRERFGGCAEELGVRRPAWGIASSVTEASVIAHQIGYPVLVRPSYVLGGRAMRVCYRANEVLRRSGRRSGRPSSTASSRTRSSSTSTRSATARRPTSRR